MNRTQSESVRSQAQPSMLSLPLSVRSLLGRSVEIVAVATVLLAWTYLYYRRGLGLGFLSDSYGLLADARQGAAHAFHWRGGNHFIPGTYLYLGLLYKLFGVGEQGYQWLGLLHLAINGGLLYWLGRRWLGSFGWALTAALIFIGNSAFYQVTCWPVNGNVHNLSATLYLLGLLVMDRAVSSARPWLFGWLFAALCFISFFTYEPTISMTVVGGGLLWWRWAERESVGVWRWLRVGKNFRRWLVVMLPTLLVGLVAFGFKVYSLSIGARAVNASGAYIDRLYLLLRAILATFTSTKMGEDSLKSLIFFGHPVAPGSTAGMLVLGFWAVVLLFGGWLILRRSGSAVRVLILWIAVHFFLCHLVTGLASRHCFLPALAAALLWVFGLRALWTKVSNRGSDSMIRSRSRMAWAVALFLAVFALISLQWMSWRHVQDAIDLHWQATRASRSVRLAIAKGIDHHPDAFRVMLVDMPKKLAGKGLKVYVFSNGLKDQVEFFFPDRFRHKALRHSEHQRPGAYANRSQMISDEQLPRVRRRPLWIVLRYDKKTGLAKWLGPKDRVKPQGESTAAEPAGPAEPPAAVPSPMPPAL